MRDFGRRRWDHAGRVASAELLMPSVAAAHRGAMWDERSEVVKVSEIDAGSGVLGGRYY